VNREPTVYNSRSPEMRNHNHAKILGGKRQIITLVLLLLGIRFWLSLPFDQKPTWMEWVGLGAGVCFSLSGYLNRAARIAAGKLRRWIVAHTCWTAALVGLLIGAYLLFQISQGRGEMFLRIHDEHSYMIQARMLAVGRLWSAPYPPDISPFFDTFHFIVDRVYASIYFPGAAMTMVPAIWLGLPYWTSPLACGAAAAAMFFLIMRELFSSLRALIAVVMLVSLQYFRWMSFMLMSETAFLLAVMVLIWTWLRWRKNGYRLRWAFLMGAAAGWAGITRPLDAICFAVPIALAAIFELRSRRSTLVKSFVAVALTALPFAAIQIVQNIGVTGNWSESPMQYYVAESYPGPLIGFGPGDMNRLPPNISAPKRAFAAGWMDLYRDHTLKNALKTWYSIRFNQIRLDTLPDTDLFILLPLALAAKWDIRRVMLLTAMLLMLIVYLGYIFHLDQYLVPIMPAMICLILMGWEALDRAWPRYRRRIGTMVAFSLIGFSLAALPEFSSRVWALPTLCEPAKFINEDLSALKTPSVVLFPFEGPGHSVDWFPVHNDDVAWPDDALVVRANDLGEDQNWKLYDYYARIQPNRRFYLYGTSDPGEPHNLHYLGTAAELAAKHAGG
jgi:hypothetical protein